MLKRINKACSYFPCHQGLEDCAFCYCPFYPCEDKNLGHYIQSIKLNPVRNYRTTSNKKGVSNGVKKNIWSCQDCGWIHKKKTADRIFKLIRRNWAALRKNTARAGKSKG